MAESKSIPLWGNAASSTDHNDTYGRNWDAGRQQAEAGYNKMAEQARGRDISSQWGDAYNQANGTLGQAQQWNQNSANDAGSQQAGIADAYGRATGSAPSAAVQSSNQAFAGSLANQRTAAASATGGAMAQAMGLRDVSQSTAGQQATQNMSGQALQAQDQNQAQQQYASAVGQNQQQNLADANSQQGIAGMYASSAAGQAQLKMQQNANNQNQDLYGQQMAYNVNQANMEAQQKNADIDEQMRETRRTAQQNKNGAIAHGVGAVTGAIGGLFSLSDERTKNKGWGVMGLDDPNLRIGEDNKGYLAQSDAVQQPSIASHYSAPEQARPQAQKPVAKPTQDRKMTPEELMAAADREIASVKRDTARRQARDSAVQPALDRGYSPKPGSYEDLVNPLIRKYPESSAPVQEHSDQGPEDNSVDYGDFDDDTLAYGQPSMSYGRRTGGLSYGGRRG